MTKDRNRPSNTLPMNTKSAPNLNISKIGIVARDYRNKFPNGYRDFSQALPAVLELLDNKGCDAALFSLFSIIPRRRYDPSAAFDTLKNINVIFLEEFEDEDGEEDRKAGRYVVYYRTRSGWKEYDFFQVFGTRTGGPKREIPDFVKNKVPERILGNFCVLLCGETNGVKYSKVDKQVHDTYGLKNAIPNGVNIILNPIHDRMTRFEMKLKRQFLSQPNRSVISVWNKGKQDIKGKVKDGSKPPWTIFYDGKPKEVSRIQNENGVEIGIFDIKKV